MVYFRNLQNRFEEQTATERFAEDDNGGEKGFPHIYIADKNIIWTNWNNKNTLNFEKKCIRFGQNTTITTTTANNNNKL